MRIMTSELAKNPVMRLVKRMATAMRPPRLRTMREFAEAEITVPDGPYGNQRFRAERNPSAALWFDAIDSGYFRRFAATAMTQDGKTLICNVIPAMYHLFERRERVVYGVPDMNVGKDKWTKDLLPAIRASRYAGLLPKRGAGSQGGETIEVEFANGAALRFMSARGGDESRSGYTAKAVVATEIDKMDEAGENSKEADPMTQFERRIGAYGAEGRIYMECSPSLTDGRIWQEITVRGSDSKIALKCPHCSDYVTPEREHLVGWADAVDVVAAGENARIVCPACGQIWQEADRVAANRAGVLVHRGQEVTPDGEVVGPMPRTDTLGFRWNVINSLLSADKIALAAREEWAAKRDADEDNAEKALLQFTWATPYKPARVDLTAVDAMSIARRVRKDARGVVPEGCHALYLGIDLGKWLHHWVLMGFGDHFTPKVIDYGRLEVPAAEFEEEAAIIMALRSFRDEVVAKGWPGADGKPVLPMLNFVDAGNWQDLVIAFCEESPSFVPAKGVGEGQTGRRVEKRTTGSKVIMVGEGYEVVQMPGKSLPMVEINVDKWKTRLHARIQTPMDKPGALTLFNGQPIDHLTYCKHLVAERKVEEFFPGKGTITVWKKIHANNHFLDASMLTIAAAHTAGERAENEPEGVRVQMSAPAANDQPPKGYVNSYKGVY